MTRTVQSYAEAHTVRPAKKPKRIKARRVTKGGKGSDPEKMAWIRSLSCLCRGSDSVGCSGQIEVHHDRSGGSRATDRHTVPLCGSGHHREGPLSIERLGRRVFQRFHKIDLVDQCQLYETEWRVRKASGAA